MREHRKGGRRVPAGAFPGRCLRALQKAAARKVLEALMRHTPEWAACLEIRILARATARGFGVPAKRFRGWSAEKTLAEYAAWSARCLKRGTKDPQRLYREAYRTGETVRRFTGFTEREDLERLVFYLYRNIRIRMGGQLPGPVAVSGCYFSRFYTPEACALMSNVDSGMIAGIFGGGELTFSERITEGARCCRAAFSASYAKGDPE